VSEWIDGPPAKLAAGMLLEFDPAKVEPGDENPVLVGHMNDIGGWCDHCPAYWRAVTVRHKVVWTPEPECGPHPPVKRFWPVDACPDCGQLYAVTEPGHTFVLRCSRCGLAFIDGGTMTWSGSETFHERCK
jgi:hypothetical protein